MGFDDLFPTHKERLLVAAFFAAVEVWGVIVMLTDWGVLRG